MQQSWVRPVEQIVLPALEGKVRVLGITSPDGKVGVSMLAEAAANTLGRSGTKVLLLDLTEAIGRDDRNRPAWTPGEVGAIKAVTAREWRLRRAGGQRHR